MGCPVLALEVLSKIPKITKKCSSSSMSKASSKTNLNTNLNSSNPLENGTQAGIDWGSSGAPTHSWGGNDSEAGFDWSQPATKAEDDELKLDWGDDKDEDDDDADGNGLTMKTPELKDGGSESGGAKLQRENSQVGMCLRLSRFEKHGKSCADPCSNSHVSPG